jgi:glycosyltransferase involved in cell wall biosynthesis
MTVGIPVVTTRGGCFEEVGGPAALYADPANASDLAERIKEALDPDIRSALMAQMPAQIARFAPERICSLWMEVYQSVQK